MLSAAPVATDKLVPRSPATQGTTFSANGPVNGTDRPRLSEVGFALGLWLGAAQ